MFITKGKSSTQYVAFFCARSLIPRKREHFSFFSYFKMFLWPYRNQFWKHQPRNFSLRSKKKREISEFFEKSLKVFWQRMSTWTRRSQFWKHLFLSITVLFMLKWPPRMPVCLFISPQFRFLQFRFWALSDPPSTENIAPLLRFLFTLLLSQALERTPFFAIYSSLSSTYTNHSKIVKLPIWIAYYFLLFKKVRKLFGSQGVEKLQTVQSLKKWPVDHCVLRTFRSFEDST